VTVPPGAAGPLHRLPPQPSRVPWPLDDWPTAPLPAGVDLDPLMDAAFDPSGPLRDTYAVACVLSGRLVYERYGDHCPASTARAGR